MTEKCARISVQSPKSTGDGKVGGRGRRGRGDNAPACDLRLHLHLHRYLALHTAAATLRGLPTHSQSAVAARRERGR
jgi:hypothetical protein